MSSITPPKPKLKLTKKTVRAPVASPKRNRQKKPQELLAIVDDAIEHGATDDAKQRLAKERARSKSPIPKGTKPRQSAAAAPPKPSSDGWGKVGIRTHEDRLKEEKARKKAEKEAKAKKKAETELKTKKKPKKEAASNQEQEAAAAAATRHKQAKQKTQDALERLKKKRAQDEARRKRKEKKNAKQNGGNQTVVKRIPKRSALMAMGGPEAKEYKKQLEREQLASWGTSSSSTATADGSNSKWQILEQTFSGRSSSESKQEQQVVTSDKKIMMSLQDGIEAFKTNPEKYIALHYWPEQKPEVFTFVLRAGTIGYEPLDVRTDGSGSHVIFRHNYQRLPPFPNDVFPKNGEKDKDAYTDTMTFQGKKLHVESKHNRKPLLPGRGMGLCDSANMKLIGDEADPNDIRQGSSVGDCWLLSAIACLADYDWAVKRIFRKTPGMVVKKDDDSSSSTILPHDNNGRPNMYTITLWDVTTWSEVDIVVDERLPVRADGSGYLLGAKPSAKGDVLWVPYLEKAIAIHCGGYDKLDGGRCTDAWPLLTGSRNQLIITKNPEGRGEKYICTAKYNTEEGKWSNLSNSPNDPKADPRVWIVDWPKVGGGGSADVELTQEELFHRIVTWDEHNYLIGAGTDGVSDQNATDGMVDNHAYSVIDSRSDICGKGIDLLLVRNPWGEGGELENGEFMRLGPGWDRHPDIKKELNPILDEDNGLMWMTKEEFFRYFPTIYVCAFNMARLRDSDYVNDLDDDYVRGKKKKATKPKKKAPVVQQDDGDELQPIHVNKDSDPTSPYKIVEQSFDGSLSYGKLNKKVVQGTSIPKGVDEFRANPEKYLAMHYQTSICEQGWPAEVHQFTYILRDGTTGLEIDAVDGCGGKRTILTNVLR